MFLEEMKHGGCAQLIFPQKLLRRLEKNLVPPAHKNKTQNIDIFCRINSNLWFHQLNVLHNKVPNLV